jgi:hypothetical protein
MGRFVHASAAASPDEHPLDIETAGRSALDGEYRL